MDDRGQTCQTVQAKTKSISKDPAKNRKKIGTRGETPFWAPPRLHSAPIGQPRIFRRPKTLRWGLQSTAKGGNSTMGLHKKGTNARANQECSYIPTFIFPPTMPQLTRTVSGPQTVCEMRQPMPSRNKDRANYPRMRDRLLAWFRRSNNTHYPTPAPKLARNQRNNCHQQY